MKILITGASGFLGKNVCDKLVEHELIKVYNSNKIEDGWICDLNRKESVKMLLEKSDPDVVVHCAANPSPKHPEDYKQFLEDHIISTVNLLEHCKPGTKFIYISSVLIFNQHPEINPVNLYGACKLACESFCNVYANIRDLRINIIRPSAIVGPGLTHGLLFDLQRKLKSDSEELELFGNEPGSIKPFVHVDEVCEWIKACTERNVTMPINCFPKDSISVKDIAEIAMQCLNIRKPIKWQSDKVWKGDFNIDTSNQQYISVKNSSRQAIEIMFNSV